MSRKLWLRVGKVLLTALVLYFVGRQFWRDLHPENAPDLWKQAVDFSWLGLSAVLYILGLGFSTFFWILLLARIGQRPPLLPAIRAYYIGHLGKYLPGKAWALMLRALLIRGPHVRVGVGVLTSFYEVLTTMAGAVVLAMIVCPFFCEDRVAGLDRETIVRLLTLRDAGPDAIDRKVLVVMATLLLAAVGTPILPPIFNRIVHRVSLPFRDEEGPAPPRVVWGDLWRGIGITAIGWVVLGGSLWAVLKSLDTPGLAFSPESVGRLSAYLSLAYVAGFVIVLIPSGIGIREFFLKVFLENELSQRLHVSAEEASAKAILAVLLLRIVWTAAEIVVNSTVYWLPGPGISDLGRNADSPQPCQT
jgi:hypothetical protein